jgi:hypothetical protein
LSVFTLPLTLTIRAVRGSKDAIEVEGEIRDAKDQSVRSISITVGPQRSPADVAAIVQRHVDDDARRLEKADLLAKVPAGPPSKGSLQSLVGKQFTGSLST